MLRISGLPAALILLLGLTALALAADDPLIKQAQGLFQPIPTQPPAIKGVNATPAMVELGKDLYFDPRACRKATTSVATLAIRSGWAAWT